MASFSDATSTAKLIVVMIVYFGEHPPWLPITLHSMAANPRVSFVVVNDRPPPAVLPANVHFETISFEGMHARLSSIASRRVSHSFTYKANDYKPLLPALYPLLVEGYEWWAWSDLDVIFGDLLKFLAIAEPHPACCHKLEQQCSKRDRRDPQSPCSDPNRPRNGADTYFDPRACPCTAGERVTAISPLYPNPWRKKCWGPFTAFRAASGALPSQPGGAELFRRTHKWQQLLAMDAYAHFDEWWGPYAGNGLETMGEAMTRLSDAGELVMAKKPLPFAEAKSCNDVECTFCPCGATRFALGPGATLRVNGKEVIVLHLGESKGAWKEWAQRGNSLPPYAPPPPAAAAAAAASAAATCFEVDHLGVLTPDAALAHAGDEPRRRLRLKHHRPASAKAAALLLYASASSSHLGPAAPIAPGAPPPPPPPPLIVRTGCGPATAASAVASTAAFSTTSSTTTTTTTAASFSSSSSSSSPASAAEVRAALQGLQRRYDAATAAEQRRAGSWLCAWALLQRTYAALLGAVDAADDDPRTRKLAYAHGNRRVRTPLYAGERLGWASVAQDLDEIRALPPQPPPCVVPPAAAAAAGAGGGGADTCTSRKMVPVEREGRRLAAAEEAPSPAPPRPAHQLIGLRGRGRGRGRGRAERRLHGRRLGQKPKGKRRGWRGPKTKGPPPGVPCMRLPAAGVADVPSLQAALFDGYAHLHHVRRAEEARVQRWRCSWLYLMRDCHAAEALLPAASQLHASCLRVQPPNDPGLLGWLDSDPAQLNATAITTLLFSWRCW